MAIKTFATEPRQETAMSRPCPLCCSPLYGAKTWKTQGVQFVRCSGCGLWRQEPMPVLEDVRKRYAVSYLEYERENHFAFRDIALMSLAEADIRPEALTEPDAGLAAPKLLEIGCATGALLDRFSKAGWQSTGVEVSRELAEYGRTEFGLDIRACTLQEAAFPDASFSHVFALHLIEHLDDPVGFIKEVRRVLAARGTLLLVTPNADSFQALLTGKNWRSAIYDHLFLFSRNTLGRLLKDEGFAINYCGTWGGWPQGMKPAAFKKPLDRLMKALGWGDVMIIKAEKI